MDLVQIIETLGIPVAVASVLGYACLFLMKFITGKLTDDLTQKHDRLEKMQIGLIDSNNKFKEAIIKNNTEVTTQLVTLIDIVTKLLQERKNGYGRSHKNN
tara:strand:- start:325 stop:627 length:303 start_codon:yes stop_codon:yes gene_type:complete